LQLIDPASRQSGQEAARKTAAAAAKAKAEAAAKAAAKEQARREAEAAAKAAAEEQARREAEAAAKAAAEEQARREAEAAAKAAAEEQARREAEAAAKAAAEEQARREAEAAAKAAAEEQARREAEAAAKAAAEEQARREAEAAAKAAAEEQARREAEAAAKAAAEEQARREAEAAAKAAAEEQARREAEAAAKAAAEEQARREAEAAAKAAAEEQARREAEAAAKAAAEEQARREAEAAAKAAAEEQARREAEAAAKAAAEEQARREAEAAARAQVDLAATFRRLIREIGPISLAQFMAESNAHYYTTRDPLGEEGDFITAPEISQMFGELVGLWLADLWVRMGSRKTIHYVELGPGRGTLARDALGAAGRYGFAPQVHFVETSPALRKLQSAAFPDCHHHHDLSTLPDDAPLLIVANEFLDALPIQQLVRSAEGWRERLIGLNGDELVFVVGDTPVDNLVPPSWRKASQGTLIETSRASVAVVAEIALRLKEQGGAALIIDYGGRELSAGSTLQALKDHQKVDPLKFPGEADLTAHVDFELLQQIVPRYGAEVMGLTTQGEWLRLLGIDTRLEALIRRNPAEAAKLKRQYDRLVRDDQMGVLFKVLGLTGRRWPIGVGFE
jgi:NADH dehydrogenase [ubiquinone] 1 alpha subcomplex assembly factor 7